MILRDSGVASILTAQQLRNPVICWRNEITGIFFIGSQLAAFPATNLLNPMTHLRWWSNPEVFAVEVDFSLAGNNSNFVAFAVHNFAGQNIEIFAGKATDSPGGLTQVFARKAIPDNRPLICEFPAGPYTELSCRIIGDDVTSRSLSAAVAYAGELLRMPRSVKMATDQVPITFGLKADVLSGFSESANFLGRLVRNEYFESKMEFSFITAADVGGALDDWVLNYIPTTPFFLAWAPSDYPDQTGFVWATSSPQLSQNLPTQRYSIAFDMRGFA
jgi:hypothetical protein